MVRLLVSISQPRTIFFSSMHLRYVLDIECVIHTWIMGGSIIYCEGGSDVY
jgi:hypothetical protein